MTTRLTWEQLPDATRSRVEALTGLVQATEHVASGRNSELAAILHTTGRGVFVKGLRTNDRRVRTQRREALINPYVRRVAPVLRCTCTTSTAGTYSASTPLSAAATLI